MIKDIAPELNKIVEAEIDAGNSISEVGPIWPRPDSICVLLSQSFKLQHDFDKTKLIYSEDFDPHGPIEEYVHIESGQTVFALMPHEKLESFHMKNKHT